MLSEFVNHLWQDDEPYQNAVDAVAAVRRYLPTYRSHTSTAQAYLRNCWERRASCDLHEKVILAYSLC